MATKIRVVNMIPQSQSNEQNDDSETKPAANPADPRIIGATAFTNLFPTTIFLSSDRGDTWVEAGIVPVGTGDYNAKFSRNALYCGNLDPALPCTSLGMEVFRSTNPFSGTLMTQIDAPPCADQPWMAVETVRRGPDSGKDRVYAAYTNWNGVISVATIDICQDGTVAAPVLNSVQLLNRAVTRNAPSVRPVIHSDGTVYAAHFDWRAPNVSPTWRERRSRMSSWRAMTTGGRTSSKTSSILVTRISAFRSPPGSTRTSMARLARTGSAPTLPLLSIRGRSTTGGSGSVGATCRERATPSTCGGRRITARRGLPTC